MRTSEYTRKTRETDITAQVNLDGTGKADINTSIKFLDHMLTSLATHSLIDIELKATGDLRHHIAEDTALVLGEALRQALQQDLRITRFADASVPMDESLAKCSLDLGGRPYSVIDLGLVNPMTEDMANEDLTHFMESLATSLRANIHIQVLYGDNDHHKAEAAFKALARCLRAATAIDPRRTEAPSSKGTL
ncbi:MAG: imidazoleglycerol-phosphate dehydratase HisB [Candidatus Bathyarchaeota archaeon]|nr:imidazoleglycerol-phosphate dehydratase HisB [Candidatus Bathyarchaeota archaeon]